MGMPKGFKHSPETIERMRRAHTGHVVTQEMKDEISRANTGRKWSRESKEAFSQSRARCEGTRGFTGFHHSDESRKKMSESHQGHTNSAEHIEKVAAWHRGRKRSERTRSLLSLRNKERVLRGGNYGKGTNGYHDSPKAGRVHYRSLLELNHYKRLDTDPTVVSYTVEYVAIQYEFEGATRRYLPDLLVHYTNGRKVLVEIKPEDTYFRSQLLTLIKMGVAMEWCMINDCEFEMWGYNELE